MSKYTRRFGTPIVIAAFTVFAACSSDTKKGPDSVALGTDSTLNKDLALAGRDSTAQPQLKDVPAAEAPAPSTAKKSAPARTTPRAPTRPAQPKTIPPATTTTPSGNTVTTNPKTGDAKEAGGGAVGMIPAGATLNTNASSKICTGTNAVGDHVTATVQNAVTGSNGATIPAGATVNMTVTALKRSENSNDKIVMEFAVNSVSFDGQHLPDRGNGDVGRGQSRQGPAGRQDGAEGRHRCGGRRDRRTHHRQEHEGDGDRRRSRRSGGCRNGGGDGELSGVHRRRRQHRADIDGACDGEGVTQTQLPFQANEGSRTSRQATTDLRNQIRSLRRFR